MSRHATRWYKNAVIYAIDVEVFQDSNGDGVGDFLGLTNRLDYLDRLGVDCLWLLPFYPTPNRDNGYDVMDYYGVDSRHGSLGDFVDFVQEAERKGFRILIDLVVNHTSDQHPWFRRARENADSKYRDYYVWAENPPEDNRIPKSAFPGEVEGDHVWTYDSEAQAYYYHRFYPFQPDLNLQNPDVLEEVRKIVRYWLQLGVSGFRVDAAALMIQEKRPGMPNPEDPHELLRELRSYANRYKGDIVLLGQDPVFLAEADDDPNELAKYFGDGNEMDMLLNFILSAHLVLALVSESGEPIEQGLDILPEIPDVGAWVNFLRNYDELNLARLPPEDRDVVFERFAPDEDAQIYGRGIRRRLAPMLEGNQQWIELAFSLLFSMSGTPLFVYGDEIGMGDDLSLPGRTAVRTPMQWSTAQNAGFSSAAPDDIVRPVISEGPYSYEHVNVADQSTDEDSLLNHVRRLISARRQAPEIGWGTLSVFSTDDPSTFAHRYDHEGSTICFAHNLGDDPVTVQIELDPDLELEAGDLVALFGGDGVRGRDNGQCEIDLGPYGYRWLRVKRKPTVTGVSEPSG